MDENIGMSIWIYTIFAGLIAIGVVYNSVRISFAERQRELASLRVLGFTRGEVSYILLGEIAFLTMLALPLGARSAPGSRGTRAGDELGSVPPAVYDSSGHLRLCGRSS
jgi:putative ABC transport system permease protein